MKPSPSCDCILGTFLFFLDESLWCCYTEDRITSLPNLSHSSWLQDLQDIALWVQTSFGDHIMITLCMCTGRAELQSNCSAMQGIEAITGMHFSPACQREFHWRTREVLAWAASLSELNLVFFLPLSLVWFQYFSYNPQALGTVLYIKQGLYSWRRINRELHHL